MTQDFDIYPELPPAPQEEETTGATLSLDEFIEKTEIQELHDNYVNINEKVKNVIAQSDIRLFMYWPSALYKSIPLIAISYKVDIPQDTVDFSQFLLTQLNKFSVLYNIYYTPTSIAEIGEENLHTKKIEFKGNFIRQTDRLVIRGVLKDGV